MEHFAEWMEMLLQGQAWFQVVWFLVAFVIGIPWMMIEGIRFRRTAPKPEEVRAFADLLQAKHGPNAHQILGQKMLDARIRGNLPARRFLKAVSAELTARLVENTHEITAEVQRRHCDEI